MNAGLIENNAVLKLSVDFSLSVIAYCEKLEAERKYIVAKQLLRAATSIGANSFEAQNCESSNDFVHKFKIAAKEVNETQYWLILCKSAPSYPDCDHLIQKLDELDKIISRIISTTKRKATN
jgi:four helix bundle protein